VVSVHRRAVNLLLDDGRLVALLPAGTPLHPWAVSAPLDATILVVEAPVHAASGVLRVGPLRIALEGAEIVDLRLRHRPRALTAEVATPFFRLVGLPPDDDPAAPVLLAVLEAFRRGGDVRALAALLGLGGGLTPSGDDALVGVLAALDLAREARPEALSLRGSLAEALTTQAAQRTTRLSAQMLAAAAAGLYAEPVLALLAALGDGAPSTGSPEQAAAALLALGHHSGADTLRGMAAALGRLLPD
jgi:hypothetical protein